MKTILLAEAGLALAIASALLLTGCNARGNGVEAGGTAPPPAQVEHEGDSNVFKADHPERFPLATASRHADAPELNATGVVSADVSRNVPVISLASGRVVEIHARLGDAVTKGQLLMRIQSNDISAAFSDYHHAEADETLARAQLERAKILYEKGAIAQKDLEVADDAEIKAKVDVDTAQEHLRVLGADMSKPSSVIEINAPVSGVITEQNVTNAAGVKTLDNSPNLFTISDMSEVWIVCDVYENQLSNVRMGEFADIHLNAYPGQVLRGRIDNIGPVLDPSIRTAKVRLQVRNPGMLRFGMFVTATFHGQTAQIVAVVPATAILHLHDRDWVYVPEGDRQFRRIEVMSGKMLSGNMQEILSGISPGQAVVSNALVLESTLEQ
ncbi:MAG TPA: efflux RND transporter periplasmic adaptor subunit [Bryobacteraceae bacterium]|jgi:cobalt-zinc-cadmium efflux system membrane fusion protein|nr:efflux RND transporter periplasmic adaptor subunit [Bryobacteraceae bacterium]